ncbi:GNAT family N-acetyltransferase [Aquimarina macrocephali]|uniref:GNAT family N-acetyltransferase n=1 Tax=Aquimarina macrocephali TaxID=666563 RepID=UPI0004670564|nr:GNAT family N-acetyltransferase [Aquimarina macrocephali]
MLEHIALKLATEADLSAMEQVGDTLFDHPIKTNRAKEFINDPRHHMVLGYDGTQIVAMASGFHYVHPDKDPVFFIDEVSVLGEYHNKGIGRKITRYLCDYAKQLDCKEAWLATEHSNTAARKAYAAAGGIEDKDPIVLINFELKNDD